jgi:outer membrane protein
MRRALGAVGALLWLVSAGVAAADPRLAYVNMVRVLEEAPQATEASSKLERDFSPREREIVALQREVRQLEDRLMREGAGMTDVTRGNLELDVRSRKRDLKRQQDEFREDLNLRKNQELAAIQRLVIEVVQALARREGFDLVVSEGVVFASARVDITEKVLERLRQESSRRGGN